MYATETLLSSVLQSRSDLKLLGFPFSEALTMAMTNFILITQCRCEMISSIEKLGYFVTVIGENTKGMFELPVNEQFKNSLDDGQNLSRQGH